MLDSKPLRVPRHQNEYDFSYIEQRHKSVDNVKQYAISKMIGRLDTKREFERMNRIHDIRRQAEAKV